MRENAFRQKYIFPIAFDKWLAEARRKRTAINLTTEVCRSRRQKHESIVRFSLNDAMEPHLLNLCIGVARMMLQHP